MPGFENGSLQADIRTPFFHNIGFNYSSPTFKICGSDGRDLSVYNPGYISINHPTNQGQIVNIRITENKTFEDASGTFDYGTQTGGTTASTAWAEVMPWFVWATINDAADDVIFFITRAFNMQRGVITANMYQKGDTGGTGEDNILILDSGITKSNWDQNPVQYIGYITMTKDASDEWTVTSLSNLEGVAKFPIRRDFNFPTGQNGAVSSNWWSSSDPADTIPVWAGGNAQYRVWPNGICRYVFDRTGVSVNGANNTTGGNMRMHLPYINRQGNLNVYPMMTWTQSSSVFFAAFRRNGGTLQRYAVPFPIDGSGSVAVKPGDMTTARGEICSIINFLAF